MIEGLLGIIRASPLALDEFLPRRRKEFAKDAKKAKRTKAQSLFSSKKANYLKINAVLS